MEEKIYFLPGDIVTLKQDIPNKPVMIVIKVVTSIIKNKINKKDILKGILCRWFTKDGFILESVFNTKDLLKI